MTTPPPGMDIVEEVAKAIAKTYSRTAQTWDGWIPHARAAIATYDRLRRAAPEWQPMREALKHMLGAIEGGTIDSEEIAGDYESGIPPHKWHEEWAYYARRALEECQPIEVVQLQPDDETPGLWIGFKTSTDRDRIVSLLKLPSPPTSQAAAVAGEDREG